MAASRKAELVALIPLVVAYDEDGRHVFVYKGSPLPDSVGADERKRLTDEGFVGAAGELVAEAVDDAGSDSK